MVTSKSNGDTAGTLKRGINGTAVICFRMSNRAGTRVKKITRPARITPLRIFASYSHFDRATGKDLTAHYFGKYETWVESYQIEGEERVEINQRVSA